jgi:ubiquinone/menaquinone biosynthesis C-methylase UbiE
MDANPGPAVLNVDPAPAGRTLQTARDRSGRSPKARELGLALGLFAGKHLLNISHLHYGIWPENLPVKLSNLRAAQQQFTNFILKHIPPTVSSILDVGCGAGALAHQLLEAGYSVDCVCPNSALVRNARKRLKNRARIYECTFEALETDRRYDLLLFSESFQYIRTYKCIEKILQLADRGALVLICDFFKTDAPGECVIGGGANLREFHELVGRYGGLEKLKDIDITARTAPTMDVFNEAIKPAATVWRLLRLLSGGRRWPLLSIFGEDVATQMEKVERKYFSGLRNAEHFATYKSYRLLMYRRA